MARELPAGTVTLLFTDIEGSTALLHQLGDGYGPLLADHHRELRQVWRDHDGVEVDTAGDSFFVAFPDADGAALAARTAQASLSRIDVPAGSRLRVRIGVHTGTPARQDDGYWGEDVHYAARVMSAAHGGQVLVTDATATRLTAPGIELESLGDHALKDFPAPRELLHLVCDGVRASAFPVPRTAARGRTNLRALAEDLVGRDADRAAVHRALDAGARVLTITGPGGVGKTELALRIAQGRLGRHADGVFAATLAEVPIADEVPAAMLAALSLAEPPELPALDALIGHLRAREVLLVLDNFEHVPDAAGALSRLLGEAPGVQLLVTSQAPLRIAGERLHPLGPLPAAQARELLLRRAREADAGFDPGSEQAVTQLCERLDGLPLAIELAGARLPLLGADTLLARLDDGLGVLRSRGQDRPERQRSLAATLDWTLGVLPAPARELLEVIAAFPAGAGLPLLTAGGADVDDILDRLEELDAYSLVHREGNRYRCAQALRRYVQSLDAGLSGRADGDACRALIALSDRLQPRQWTDYTSVTAELSGERGNILAALHWAAAHEPELHHRLLAATGWWATIAGAGWEYAAHLLRLGPVTGEQPWQTDLRGYIALARFQQSGDQAAFAAELFAYADEAAAQDRPQDAAPMLFGAVHWMGDETTMYALYERARELAGQATVGWTRDLVACNEAQVLAIEGNAEALERVSRGLVTRATPGSYFSGWHFWADAAMLRGDAADTAPRYGRALAAAWAAADLGQSCFELDGLAMGLILAGRHSDGLAVKAATDALRGELALSQPPPWWQAAWARHEAQALEVVDPIAASEAVASANRLSAPELITHGMKLAAAVAAERPAGSADQLAD